MPRMTAPAKGVKVRMYRHGHGDCFLLAFPRDNDVQHPVYVLIDCGIKPGSQVKADIDDIVNDIKISTGGRIDIVAITHEHQDHVSAFSTIRDGRPIFDSIEFDQCWLAWTEDGSDILANSLRERFRDTLVALAFAQEKVQALQGVDDGLKDRLNELLGTEIGDDGVAPPIGTEGAEILRRFRVAKQENPLLPAAALADLALKGKTNKDAIAYVRGRAAAPVRFFRPEDDPIPLPGAPAIKVYVLGPPRDDKLLLDLNPKGSEEFKLAPAGTKMAVGANARGFAQAVAPEMDTESSASPFAMRYCLPDRPQGQRDKVGAARAKYSVMTHLLPANKNEERSASDRARDYLRQTYGGPDPDPNDPNDWRRIDYDWLGMSEALALRLNDEVNNTSLVLAFELPNTGRVLLFSGDAQRGNWLGWSNLEWTLGDETKVTAKELLGRCVLYKVGHHGSHNATLNGNDQDDYANLGWMARGAFADEFVAMIPANTKWAMNKTRPWLHPLPEIEAALHKKARGRVFRSDLDKVEKPDPSILSEAEWQAFLKRTSTKLRFFDYVIEDE